MSHAMSAFDPSQVMNVLLRMVVPMRREFGCNLDVKHFLHDFDYAQDILNQALKSQDSRLRDYAQYVKKLMAGPRIAEAPAAPPASAAAAPASIIETLPPSVLPGDTGDATSEEEALRKRIMQKYTSGLR
jgi:hypothetical protein